MYFGYVHNKKYAEMLVLKLDVKRRMPYTRNKGYNGDVASQTTHFRKQTKMIWLELSRASQR